MTAKQNVYQRLAAVMSEVSYIQKESKKGMNYTIVLHDAVTAKVRPVLLKHGIVYHPIRCDHQHNGNRAECSMTVRFVNVDDREDFFDVPSFGYGIDQQDKGPGKAMSYAVKYALLKALGLETGDDPDMENTDFTESDPATPPFNPEAAAATVKDIFKKQKSLADLEASWGSTSDQRRDIHNADPAAHDSVKQAFIARKTELTEQQGKAA